MIEMVKYRILVVDDDKEFLDDIVEYLQDTHTDKNEGFDLNIVPCQNFDMALDILEDMRIDLIFLDVKLEGDSFRDERKGVKTLETIKSKRFLPVIFFTALANDVRHLEAKPTIQVLQKGAAFHEIDLYRVMVDALNTAVSMINRTLTNAVDKIQRDYMWDNTERFVTNNDTIDEYSLFYTVARRLSISLSDTNLQQFFGDGKNIYHDASTIPPERYYIIPPLRDTPIMSGDIYKQQNQYIVILTPSCDLVESRVKAEFVTVAKCEKIEDFPDYSIWISKNPRPDQLTSSMKNFLKGNPSKLKQTSEPDRDDPNKLNQVPNEYKTQSGRYFFLPRVRGLPNLFVDMQQLNTIPYDELTSRWSREASLDSPFSEALIAKFTAFFGRLGTPDLDLAIVRKEIDKRHPPT